MTEQLPLIVMGLGVLLVAVGAAMVLPAAGLIAAGVLLVALAWPQGDES